MHSSWSGVGRAQRRGENEGGAREWEWWVVSVGMDAGDSVWGGFLGFWSQVQGGCLDEAGGRQLVVVTHLVLGAGWGSHQSDTWQGPVCRESGAVPQARILAVWCCGPGRHQAIEGVLEVHWLWAREQQWSAWVECSADATCPGPSATLPQLAFQEWCHLVPAGVLVA